MKDKLVPKYKMTDAVADVPETADYPQMNRPADTPPHPADLKQHNAEVHQSREDHLVQVGRADQTTGRGG